MDNLEPSVTPDRSSRLLFTLEQLLRLQATEVKSTLDQACQLITHTLHADKVDIFLYQPSNDTLVARGTSDTPLGRREIALGLDRLPLTNGGRAAHVFQTGEKFRSGHVEQDPEELPGIKHGLGIRSMLAVPLEVSGERRGVIQVDSAQPDVFSADDLDFLEAVAHWIGLMLHRAELVEHVSQQAAEKARRDVGDEMIMILAHDLRVPLTPVKGYLAMIMAEAEQHEQQTILAYARNAQRGVDRLTRMITDLLDTARLEHGIFSVVPEVVDLPALVHEIATVMETPRMPIEVRVVEASVIEADRSRIRQALENLVSNAQRYSPEGVPVVIECACEHAPGRDRAVLTIRDAGPGIAPELLPRLFSRFMRGQGTKGLGLGLYLARGIAEAHGGTLRVESTPGKGTSFFLALPLPTDRS